MLLEEYKEQVNKLREAWGQRSQKKEEYKEELDKCYVDLVAANQYTGEKIVQLNRRISEYKNKIAALQDIDNKFEDIDILIALAEEDTSILEELEVAWDDLEKVVYHYKINDLLTDPHDNQDVFLTIHAGAGGTEAQDWAEMLMRMYIRYAARNNWNCKIMDILGGDVAGVKSVTLSIEGANAYGYLKGEHGVHRLIRVSPFNAQGKRQTSFAAIEVTPQLDDELDLEVRAEDCEYQTFRSGGPGGQYQNTTESGIRIIHKPSGIIVECRQERSQIKNKEVALKMLKGKLAQRQREAQQAELKGLKGTQAQIEWGHQIRTYTFMPYQLVKDERTGFSTAQIDKVMDGDLQVMIEEYLEYENNQ